MKFNRENKKILVVLILGCIFIDMFLIIFIEFFNLYFKLYDLGIITADTFALSFLLFMINLCLTLNFIHQAVLEGIR